MQTYILDNYDKKV